VRVSPRPQRRAGHRGERASGRRGRHRLTGRPATAHRGCPASGEARPVQPAAAPALHPRAAPGTPARNPAAEDLARRGVVLTARLRSRTGDAARARAGYRAAWRGVPRRRRQRHPARRGGRGGDRAARLGLHVAVPSAARAFSVRAGGPRGGGSATSPVTGRGAGPSLVTEHGGRGCCSWTPGYPRRPPPAARPTVWFQRVQTEYCLRSRRAEGDTLTRWPPGPA